MVPAVSISGWKGPVCPLVPSCSCGASCGRHGWRRITMALQGIHSTWQQSRLLTKSRGNADNGPYQFLSSWRVLATPQLSLCGLSVVCCAEAVQLTLSCLSRRNCSKYRETLGVLLVEGRLSDLLHHHLGPASPALFLNEYLKHSAGAMEREVPIPQQRHTCNWKRIHLALNLNLGIENSLSHVFPPVL